MASLISNRGSGVVPRVLADGFQVSGNKPCVCRCVTAPSVEIVNSTLVIGSALKLPLNQGMVADASDKQAAPVGNKRAYQGDQHRYVCLAHHAPRHSAPRTALPTGTSANTSPVFPARAATIAADCAAASFPKLRMARFGVLRT